MKKMMMSFGLVLLASSMAMASSSKICFGSRGGDETAGVILKAEISRKAVSLKMVRPIDDPNQDFSGGPYPTYNESVNGRDGKTYLTYKGSDAGEYQNVILVDEALLQAGTTGLLQIRARGEGFFNSVFVCKDAR